jgi:hypothetical protein
VAAFVLKAFSSPGVALAGDDDTCASTYSAIKGAHTEGKLLFARENAVSCARACAKADAAELKSLGEECLNQWIPRLETDIPTVVLVVRDASGKETSAFKVELDGAPLALGADGKAIELDPGNHSFRFLSDGQSAVSVTLPIKQGEKNKRIEGNLGARETPASTTDSLIYAGIGIAAGGAVLGAIGGVLLGVATSDYSSAEEDGSCDADGFCNQAGYDRRASAVELFDAGTGVAIAGGVVLVAGVVTAIIGAAMPDGREVGGLRLRPSARGLSLEF